MKLYQTILYNTIKKRSRVIDLGCGSGELLEYLINEKSCEGYGIEKDFSQCMAAMTRGISVFQGDVLEGLKSFDTHAFDVAILSQTLQQVVNPISVINEMCRVAQIAIVTFPNFAYWKIRWQLLVMGQSPKTNQLPYDWHNTPNIRVITIKDFRRLCAKESIEIVKEIPLAKLRLQRLMFPLMWTNFFTEKGIFIIKNKDEII
jgi:methionine biosynthesis protein MetW